MDLRSYARQGLDIVPTVHEGAAVRQMDGVAFFYLILGRKKAGDLFQISCSVCRCVSGGDLVVKVRNKLTRCIRNNKPEVL